MSAASTVTAATVTTGTTGTGTLAEPLTPTSISTRGRSSTSTSTSASLSKGSKRESKDSKDSKASSGSSKSDWTEYPMPAGITIGSKERVPQAVAVLAPAFAQDPILTYVLNSLDPVARRAYLPTTHTRVTESRVIVRQAYDMGV
ncbi:hypothetical protein V491_04873 [Pseudogymnoascus sp. VKM F-3775]|nr:hypothetical protein V491_04873 [Pseudogymnoascus sp. VKM F-3775]